MKDRLKHYIESNKDRFLEELFELLKIPSVSADAAFSEDVLEAAEFIRNSLEVAGLEQVKIYPTEGFPLVYGEKIIDPKLPTVLVYGHYDVQPADPYELWESSPFEPVIRDEKIYARGASDDKGQAYMHVKAIEFLIKDNSLPCNVKFIIEGEEEIGSKNLESFVKNNKDLLKSDVVLISDTSMLSNDLPSITVGIRGISYMEVELTGPNKDLHSGLYGGAVANPANVLCEMISSLKDEYKRITIPGFYDDVLEIPPLERETMKKIPFNEEVYKSKLQVNDLEGEKDFSTYERSALRPSLDVNGIWSGYIKEGSKTVLPSKANAKISMRLVANQDSKKISKLFAEHFEKIAPASVKVKITSHHGAEPVKISTESIEYKAAHLAIMDTFNIKPLPFASGGSIPIVALFDKELGLKSVLMGFGLDTDSIHSPNEHFGVFNFLKGIETIPFFYHHYSRMKNESDC